MISRLCVPLPSQKPIARLNNCTRMCLEINLMKLRGREGGPLWLMKYCTLNEIKIASNVWPSVIIHKHRSPLPYNYCAQQISFLESSLLYKLSTCTTCYHSKRLATRPCVACLLKAIRIIWFSAIYYWALASWQHQMPVGSIWFVNLPLFTLCLLLLNE